MSISTSQVRGRACASAKVLECLAACHVREVAELFSYGHGVVCISVVITVRLWVLSKLYSGKFLIMLRVTF